MSRFKVAASELKEFATLYSRRKTLCEEVDYLAGKEGVSWLVDGLCLDLDNGLKQSEIQERRTVFGDNKRIEKPPPTFIKLWLEALDDFTLKVLIVAGLVSIVIDEATADDNTERIYAWIEGFAILMAVFISSFVQAINNYQKEKEFRNLREQAEKFKKVTIKRDGVPVQSELSEVVVGDLVQVRSGMEVAGDGFCISSFGIQADESSLTGESQKMEKDTFEKCWAEKEKIERHGHTLTATLHDVPSPIFMAGTKISKGEGWMIVINVGKNSAIGSIQDLIATDDEQSPLEEKLEKLAGDIGKFGLGMAIVTVIVLLIRWIIEIVQEGWKSEHGQDLVRYFIIGITILVVSIPEGLPLAVTLVLSFSLKKMTKDGNLVKKMYACETMGGATVICSDKTGTLTKNEMILTKYWNRQEEITYDISNEKYLTYTKFMPTSIMQAWIDIGAICSVDSTKQDGGSATELAILKYLEAEGINVDACREPVVYHKKILFSSDRKRMSVIIDTNLSKTGRRIYTKGASEYIVGSCSQFYDFQTNLVIPFDASITEEANRAIEKMAKNSLRTIGLAYKDISPSEDIETVGEKDVFLVEKSGYTMIGIIGIMDPLRKGVKKAVKRCHRAGVDVKMVTGDNKITARAIARDCGIIPADFHGEDDTVVLEGEEFIKLVGGVVCAHHKHNMDACDCVRNEDEQKKPENKGKKIKEPTVLHDKVFDEIFTKIKVMARSRPEDKYCMVVGIKERGHVVAVTGDGTNDAPALKKASVGFAMGKAGTEVAKEAAAIILTNDDFPSIVQAILWGRNVYVCIRKFIQFQLTVNIVALISVLISAAYFRESLLSSIQLLWVNLIMDTLASLALTSEPPEKKLLKMKPYRKNERVINWNMAKNMIYQAIYQLVVLLVTVFTGKWWLPETVRKHQNVDKDGYFVPFIHPGTIVEKWDFEVEGYSRMFTFLFNVFVFMTIFNMINSRKLFGELNIFSGIHKAPLFIIIFVLIFLLQIIIITLGSTVFQIATWGLGLYEWIICMGFAIMTLPVTFIGKLIFGKCCQNKDDKPDKADKKDVLAVEHPPPDEFKRSSAKRASSILSLKHGQGYTKKRSHPSIH